MKQHRVILKMSVLVRVKGLSLDCETYNLIIYYKNSKDIKAQVIHFAKG